MQPRKPAGRPPAHGTPARYRGGSRKDGTTWTACRCAKCQAWRREDYQRAKDRAAAPPALTVVPPAAPDLDQADAAGDEAEDAPPARGGPGPTEKAIQADLDRLSAAADDLAGEDPVPLRSTLTALALALAREIDRPRASSVAGAIRELREVMAQLQPEAVQEGFTFDDDDGEPEGGDWP